MVVKGAQNEWVQTTKKNVKRATLEAKMSKLSFKLPADIICDKLDD